MKNFITAFFAVLLTMAAVPAIWAQCPGSISIGTANITPANCPSTGSVRITSNAGQGALSYMLINGPAGAPLNSAQDDSNFSALPAGAYMVKAFCKTDPSNADTAAFTILNNYTPFDSATVTIKQACNGDGMIRILSVAGGKAPFTYALSPQATYPAGLSAYQSVDSFSNLAAGMYTIRIKDACGQYLNKQAEVLPPLPAPKVSIGVINGEPCANNTWGFHITGATNPVTGANIDLTPYFQNQNGLILNIYAITGNCQKGALLTTYNPVTAGSPYFAAAKKNKYWVEAVTSCGQTYGYCTATSGLISDPYIDLQASGTGCGTAGSPAVMSIVTTYSWLTRWPTGITVTVKNGANADIPGSPFKFHSPGELNTALSNLPHDAYTITATDTCGILLVNKTMPDVTLAGTPTASVLNYYMDCITQTGTTDVAIRIGGYVPNLGNGDSVVISSGPSNVGVSGFTNNKTDGTYTWTNLLTGNYTVKVYTSCGNSADIPFTIAATTMKRFISAKASSFCTGGGKVEIDSTFYNGDGITEYVLVKTTGNIRVDSNITGTFTNLPNGDYKIALKITGYCSYALTTSYEVYSNTVSIVQGGSAPRIVKKLAMACEDVSGTVLPNGTIYLNLAGPAPLKLEYIDSSATTPAWVTYKDSAAATETISGLNAGHTYYLRASGCTGGVIEPVTFGQMNPITLNNTVQPCVGYPYTLSIPEMPGAVYEWRNPSNVVVSTNPSYDIINYNASYDGTYTCKATFSGCVTRTVAATLNSQICGLPLPIHLTSFTAENKNCNAVLSWTAMPNSTDKEFTVERSINGKHFEAIATVPVKKQPNASYSYTDLSGEISNNSLYYRLKLSDLDGSSIYSDVRMVKSCKGNSGPGNLVITPNPTVSGQGFSLLYDGSITNGTCSIVNTTGQVVLKQAVTFENGAPVYIALQKMTPGIYIVVLTDNTNKVSGSAKLVIR